MSAHVTTPWSIPSVFRGIPASRPATQPPAKRATSALITVQIPCTIPNPATESSGEATSNVVSPMPSPRRLRRNCVTIATTAPAKIAPHETRLMAAEMRP